MSTASTLEKCTEVTLLRSEGGSQIITLPEVATLGDLLRAAGIVSLSPNMLIDGRRLEETVILSPGTIITIGPEQARAPSHRDWRDSVGTVQDTPAFRAMIAEGRAIREADQEAPGNEPDEADA